MGMNHPRVGKKEVDWDVLRVKLQAQALEMQALREASLHASTQTPYIVASDEATRATSHTPSLQGTVADEMV